jgi:hypothetical protein
MPMGNELSKFIVVKPTLVSIGPLRISISNLMGLIDQMLIMSVITWSWTGRMGWMNVILENLGISLSSFCIMRWRRARYKLWRGMDGL